MCPFGQFQTKIMILTSRVGYEYWTEPTVLSLESTQNSGSVTMPSNGCSYSKLTNRFVPSGKGSFGGTILGSPMICGGQNQRGDILSDCSIWNTRVKCFRSYDLKLTTARLVFSINNSNIIKIKMNLIENAGFSGLMQRQ